MEKIEVNGKIYTRTTVNPIDPYKDIYFNGQWYTNEEESEHKLMNAPLLSLNEILEAWDTGAGKDYYKSSPLFLKFKEAAKAKL